MRQCNRSDLNRHHQICARTAAGQRGERREQRAATRPSADCLRSGAEGGAGEERTHLGPRSAARRAPGAASAAGRSSRAMPGALALPLCSLAAVCRAKPLSGGVFLPPHGIFVLSRDDLAQAALRLAGASTLRAGRRPRECFGRRPPIWGAPWPVAIAATRRQPGSALARINGAALGGGAADLGLR